MGASALALSCGTSPVGGPRTHSPDGMALPQQPASFGAVIVEAVEEAPGSETELGISPNLVATFDDARSALPLLAAGGVSLDLFVQAHRLKDAAGADELFRLVEQATSEGVPVNPIPVLSPDAGYFPNATNHEDFATLVRDLTQQWSDRGLAPTTLLVDMEPPRELTEAFSTFNIVEAMPRRHIDEERFETARSAYAALVDELHAQGWKVAASTQGTVLGDYRDDDDDIRQYFNVVLEGIDWDRIDFQLYRSIFAEQESGLGPFFVYSFAQSAQQHFPDIPVGVALGVTHPGPIFPDKPTLAGPPVLAEDVAAALAAGIERDHISVYNLKGILVGPPICDAVLPCDGSEYQYGPNDRSAWFVTPSSARPKEDDGATESLWGKLDMMDTLLNLSEAGGEESS